MRCGQARRAPQAKTLRQRWRCTCPRLNQERQGTSRLGCPVLAANPARRRPLGLLLVVAVWLPALASCDFAPYKALPDVSAVTVYFVHCDSAWDQTFCTGPSHQASPETFTVIISRQAVMRHHLYGFHDCEVYSPVEWYCLDTKNNPVGLTPTGAMIWQELRDAHQIAVSRAEYLKTPQEKQNSPKP